MSTIQNREVAEWRISLCYRVSVAAPWMLANCSLGAWKMSGAYPEAPEKQSLREKSQSQETSSCQAFAVFTRSWAAQEGRHPPPGTLPPGTEFSLQGCGCRFSPLPQMHREYRLPSLQSVLSPGSAWGGWVCRFRGRRLRRTQRKAKLTPTQL